MSPPMGPHYLDVPYMSDRRPYLGKSSTLPAQENATPGRCIDMVTLPGGATPTHTHHQRWSNPDDSSPAWGTIQHTCRRPLTEYRVHSRDFTMSPGKEWEGSQQQETAQDDSLKRDCKPQIPPKVPRSITDVDLSEPNVSFCWLLCFKKKKTLGYLVLERELSMLWVWCLTFHHAHLHFRTAYSAILPHMLIQCAWMGLLRMLTTILNRDSHVVLIKQQV